MSEALKVKFWGVRGSHPTPGAGTVKFGGNTACVEVRAGNKTLILDAGTGIIPLGRDLTRRFAAQKRPLEAILLFSHLHHDHTQGFPFFAPAYMPNARLNIFGPGMSPEILEKVLENNQSPTTFPVGLAAAISGSPTGNVAGDWLFSSTFSSISGETPGPKMFSLAFGM